jgi:hypothetical protein
MRRWAGLAQLVEQRFCKPKVAGSTPASGTTQNYLSGTDPSQPLRRSELPPDFQGLWQTAHRLTRPREQFGYSQAPYCRQILWSPEKLAPVADAASRLDDLVEAEEAALLLPVQGDIRSAQQPPAC